MAILRKKTPTTAKEVVKPALTPVAGVPPAISPIEK